MKALTLMLVLLSSLVVRAPAIARWEPQASGVAARLRGVSAVNEQVVWASGSAGTVLRTADGGTTWAALRVPGAEALDFRDVDAVDADTAYVLSIGPGEASRIYKTADRGANWELQFTNAEPKAFFDAMAFWDASRGLVMGDSIDGRFDMLRTMDGGRTWTRIPAASLPPALAGEGAFAGSGTNVAVLPGGHAWIGTGAAARCRVLHTSDYGTTWTIADTPVAGSASAGVFSVAFRDPRHGMIVGGDYRKERDAVNNAAFTEDGGVTWRAVTGLGGFRSVVAPVPRTRAGWLAVGPQGADISGDNGATWTAIQGDGYHAFAVAAGRAIGWGVGEKGRIGRLTW